MVQFCCVVGCGNRSNRDNKQFYRLPNVPKKCYKYSFKADIIMNRRKQWLMNIDREDLKDGDAAYSPGYIRVCSDHFVLGKPSSWSDVDDIDWAPTVMMGPYDIKRKRRKLGPSARNRGRVHASTVLKRRLRAEELKTKRDILHLLTLESDPENSGERLTVHPIIHRITADCIIKIEQDPDNCQRTDTTETGKETISELKFEIDEFGND